MKKKANRDFVRNVLALMTGTTVAQAIPIAISPILTRIYTPAEFGVFALFLSLTAVIGVIANGCYEQAIILPEEDDDALNLVALGLLITLTLSMVLLVVALLFKNDIANLLGNREIAPWLFLVPFSILFIGFNNVLVFFNSRKKQFFDIAKSNMVKSSVQSVIQVSAGAIHWGIAGLILGQVISLVTANLKLLRNTIANKNIKEIINTASMKQNAKKYDDFPKYSVVSILANALSVNIGSFLITRFFSVATLGQYALVQRTMTLPANLIAKSVGQVFYQQAAEERRKKGNASKIFFATFKKLFILSILIFGVVFFLVEDVFAFVFGEKWRDAGVYAQIMVPLFAIRFIVSPLSVINLIMLKNKMTMVINFLLLFTSVSVFFVSDRYQINFEATLYLLSSSLICIYLGYLIMLFYNVTHDKGDKHVSEK